LLAALIVGAFVYFTARPNTFLHPLRKAVTDVPMWSGPTSAHSAGLGADELNNIDIYKNAKDSVVTVSSTVYQRTIFFELVPQKDIGSGFIINSEGQILTNNHVVSGGQEIEVTLNDGSRYKARILRRHRANDLALIKIDPRKKLSNLTLGDSDRLQVGQKVLAIGNPFGYFTGTLTVGVVSTLGRDIPTESGNLEGMIQTDAAINSGNSGGPLLDSQGNVIGINTAIYAGGNGGGNVGIGFAMPINRAKTMLEDMRTGRKPARLGVSTVFIPAELAEALHITNSAGLLIQEVSRRSAAADAGLKGANDQVRVGNQRLGVGGDLIVAIDGKPIKEPDAVSRALSQKHAGDMVDLSIYRASKQMNVKVKLGEAPEDDNQ
jgi:S1-C subfamily serine protease